MAGQSEVLLSALSRQLLQIHKAAQAAAFCHSSVSNLHVLQRQATSTQLHGHGASGVLQGSGDVSAEGREDNAACGEAVPR